MPIKFDHFSIQSADEIARIAGPLFRNTKFNYFSYFKEYKDKSRSLLSTNPDWTYFLYNQEYVSITEFNPKPESESKGSKDKTGNFLWEWLPNLLPTDKLRTEFFKKMRDSQQFNINSGISIIKKVKDDYEYFNFGTSESSSYIYNFYFNNISILDRFIVFFKVNASDLLDVSSTKKVIIPKSYESKIIEKKDDMDVTDFLSQTKIKKYPIEYRGYVSSISVRQLHCLIFVCQGLSSKEIATKLSISYRTVEKHLQLLKEDFDLNTKSDLLKFAAQPTVQEYFNYEKFIFDDE